MGDRSGGFKRGWAWLVAHSTLIAGVALSIAIVAMTGVGVWRLWKMFPPTNPTEAWTAFTAIAGGISALCTIGIAAFAFRGLKSLRIARDEIVHRTATEAKLCAVKRLEEIAKELVPMNTTVLDGLAEAKMKVFLGPNERVRFDPDPTDLKAARAWYDALNGDPYKRVVTFLNRLEAWSVYFTTGVADPVVAFGPIAPLLRSWVGQYYAILLMLRSGTLEVSGRFPNLVQLYQQWSAEMDAQQLARLHKDIEGQMEQAKDRLDKSKLPDIIPKL
jgi:hypothetical protein